jgi:hypothetical protein
MLLFDFDIQRSPKQLLLFLTFIPLALICAVIFYYFISKLRIMRKLIIMSLFLSWNVVRAQETHQYTIEGKTITIQKNTANTSLHYTPLGNAGINPDPSKYNILIMGDGFPATSQSTFNSNADAARSGMILKAPYSDHSSLFKFYRVNVISNSLVTVPRKLFGNCTQSGNDLNQRPAVPALGTQYGDNLVVPCQLVFSMIPEVIHELAAQIFPEYDGIVVISNTSGEVIERGLCVYGICYIGNNSINIGKVLAHEMGHHIGRLGDEYTLAFPGTPTNYTGCEPVYKNITKCRPISSCSSIDNCNVDHSIKFTNWTSLVSNDPVPGASYHSSTLFRPSDNCYMRDNNNPIPFCAICSTELVRNFCPPPKPPRISSNGIPGSKYIEVLPNQSSIINVPSGTAKVEVRVGPNYRFETTLDSFQCDNNTILFTAQGDPNLTFRWYEVIRNEIAISGVIRSET